MEIIFVYNAKSDRISTLLDFAHKIVNPSTYACDLCKLTHATFGEREAWKAFTKGSDAPLTFFHIDEFEELYSKRFTYPIVLKKEVDDLTILLNAEAIADFKSTEDLVSAIKELL